MNAVLIPLKRKPCVQIEKGDKTAILLKTRPELKLPFKCFIYETDDRYCDEHFQYAVGYIGRGKVIGEFVCIGFTYISACYDSYRNKHLLNTAFIENRLCISDYDLFNFLYKDEDHCGGWVLHMSDIKIYDEPKELSEFKKPICSKCAGGCLTCPHWNFSECLIDRAMHFSPHLWCYVEE